MNRNSIQSGGKPSARVSSNRGPRNASGGVNMNNKTSNNRDYSQSGNRPSGQYNNQTNLNRNTRHHNRNGYYYIILISS